MAKKRTVRKSSAKRSAPARRKDHFEIPNNLIILLGAAALLLLALFLY